VILDNIVKLKYKILFFIIVLFTIISIVRTVSNINNYYEEKELEQKRIIKQANYIYNLQINMVKVAFTNRLKSFVSEKIVKDAIKNTDLDTLYKISNKKFKDIQKDFPALTVMQFHILNTNLALKINNEKKVVHKNDIKRDMIVRAIKTAKIQVGFEAGLCDPDKLIYRVVLPIMNNGEVLSIVELGMDAKGMLQKIDDFFKFSRDTQAYIALLKEKEVGAKITSFNQYQIITNYQTIDKILEKIDIKKDTQDITLDGKIYLVFWNKHSLNDFRNQKIGTILYGFDITELENKLENNIMLSIVQPLIAIIFFIIIVNVIFNYATKQNEIFKDKIKCIVDNQKAIVIVTNGKTILQANQTFFDFFNIEKLEYFLENYSCICDKFVESNEYLQKKVDGKTWLEYILLNGDKTHKVKIDDYNGITHIFQISARVFSKDNTTEYVVSFDDITNIELQNKNLEKLVEEKTKELQVINEDLKRSNYELELATLDVANQSMKVQYLNVNLKKEIAKEVEKNRSKDKQLIQQSRLAQMGEMISMIAHQWRQPLAAISSIGSAIKVKATLNKLDKESSIELSNKILDYSQHLSSTIDDFRDFFKENKEKKEITYNELINSVLSIVEISVTNKEIILEQKLNSDIVFHTYPNEIKQVILNLIKNAEDVLVENNIENPKITIETDGNTLSISDNGGGISEEIQNKIFDPYFSTKTKKDGTGLGLYMSKTIIEEHCGGELTVSNNKDGAVFTIKLEEEIIDAN